MSEVTKRSWRTGGVGTRKSFICQRFNLFSVPFSLCPLRRRGTHLVEIFLGSFWGFVCRQPPPANPFSKPLIVGILSLLFWVLTFRARRARTVLESVRQSVPEDGGCLTEGSTGCLRRPLRPRFRSVQRGSRVSPECPDSFLTLRWHSRDTFSTLQSSSKAFIHWNALPSLANSKGAFLHWFCLVASPSPNSVPR